MLVAIALRGIQKIDPQLARHGEDVIDFPLPELLAPHASKLPGAYTHYGNGQFGASKSSVLHADSADLTISG